MSELVLVVDGNADSREELVRALAATQTRTLAAATGREALRDLGALGVRPSAIVVDPRSVSDAVVLLDASSSSPLVVQVPIILAGVWPADAAALPPHVRVTPGRGADPSLLALLVSLIGGAPPLPETSLARGTGGLAAGGEPDLHAYAASKVVAYLGEARGRATFAAVLAEVALERIASPADLHRVAAALRTRGDREAAVAVLLSGRATLFESGRTLRGRY